MGNIKNMMIEIINTCDRECNICEASIGLREVKHLSTSLVKEMIDFLIKKGVESISFTGGEPLLRFKDLIEMLTYCKLNSISTRLYSNGISLDQNKISELEKYLDDYIISFDSNDKKINSIIRGDAKYKIVLRNIEALSKSSINLYVISVCTAVNYDEINNLVPLIEKYNIIGWMIQQFIPLGIGLKNKELFELSLNKFNKKINEIKLICKFPILSYPYKSGESKRVFINCEGNFIDYYNSIKIGYVFDTAIHQKIFNSHTYRNIKRTI